MLPTKDTSEVSLEEYVSVIRRRWLWILLTPLVLGGLMLFRDLRAEPVYAAQAQLLLRSDTTSNIFSPSAPPAQPERALQNELRVINSRNVKEEVAKVYGEPISVRALAGGEDDVVILSATDNTAEGAAEKVNVYADTYQTVRLSTLIGDLANGKRIVQQQIDDFQTNVDQINAPLAELDARILSTSTDDPNYSALINEREQLKERTDAQRNEAQNNLNDYQERLQVLQLSERLTTTGGIQILNPATVPDAPISPTVARDVVQAVVVGLFVGLALAFIRDQFDDSLRSKVDVERAVRDLPTFGLVPYDASRDDKRNPKRKPKLSTMTAPLSATAEAYRALRTALQYAALERPLRTIQITSASAGESKTTTLSNLAMAYALSGKRIVVVDCDLRRPELYRFMQVDGTKGLTSVVLGDHTLDEALQTSPLHPNVDVLASGHLPPNPSELLSQERTGKILQALTERYAMVFVDCPPVLPVTDALVLSRYADATLFVVMANRTSRRSARRATEMLRQVGAPLLATVISGTTDRDSYGSLYEYYGYAQHSSIPIIGRFIKRSRGAMPTSTENILPSADENGVRSESEQVST